MAARYKTVKEYHDEIEANRDGLTPQQDKAIFHTGRAQMHAVAFARDNDAVTVEGMRYGPIERDLKFGSCGTSYGAKLEHDDLFRPDKSSSLSPCDQNTFANDVWDRASKTYAEQASGKVEVFIGPPGVEDPKIGERSTFARIERDELIRNSKVTKINGVDREKLLDILNTEKPTEATKQINELLETGHKNRERRQNKSIELNESKQNQTPLEYLREKKATHKAGPDKKK